ncbi:MAG: ATP-binding protein [Bdellovibrionia bacterium]
MGNWLKSKLRSIADRYRTSVSIQLLSAVLIIISGMTLITTSVQLSLNYHDEVRDLREDLELIEKGYSAGLTQSIWEMNAPQIRAALRGILHVPGVQYVEITEGEKILFSAGKPASGKTLTQTFPLNYQNRTEVVFLGQMRVVATLDHIYSKLQKTLIFIFFAQLIKTLIVSALLFLVIRHLLIRHLITITDYLKKLDFSGFTPDLKLSRDKKAPGTLNATDELDVLVNAINRMKVNLHQSYEKLNTFNQELENKVEERTHQLRESQRIITEQQNVLIAAAKLSALGEMAGGMAHEINNPLTAIQGLSYLMSKTLSNEHYDRDEFKRMISSMIELTDRIARIIQGLRDFSRDASHDPIEEIKVHHLIESTLGFCAERFKAHEISLIIDPLSSELCFEGRETELSQVLLNLLNNAYDAVIAQEDEQQEKWIRITARDLDSKVEIRVTDSGSGIPAEVQRKLFQPFFTTKEIGKGTGQGLSISFGILRAHHGELVLDDKAAHTSFVIRIPKKQIAIEEAAID